MYYYHSDHLGTGTFLSDTYGNPYQFFLNLPFGETMIEQHSYTGDYTNRYKFNGKELDEETGFYYYGARYYNPKFSIWLSTDPLAEKYPNVNPYVYCLQNPVNLVDPTGMAPEDIKILDKNGTHLFTLDDGKKKVTTMTVDQLYDKGIQWFEPQANNYIPLKSVEGTFTYNSYEGVLHTSFDEIVDWSVKENRYATSFAPYMPGDWKSSDTGGRGFKLTECDGKPYWTDALGQIPFAIDTYEHYLRNSSSTPDIETVKTGAQFANGLPYIGADYRRTYDNMMIIKTTEWAKKHMGPFSPKNNTFEWYTRSLNLYSDSLSNPATANQALKYSRIIHN